MRRTDIPQLVTFFLSRFSRNLGKRISAVAPETLQRLKRLRVPGNVRELQTVIERAVVLCEGPVLEIDRDLLLLPAAAHVSEPAAPSASAESAPANELAGQVARRAPPVDIVPLEEIERRHITAALESTAGVIHDPKGAARILKLHPNALRSRMEKLGITFKRMWQET